MLFSMQDKQVALKEDVFARGMRFYLTWITETSNIPEPFPSVICHLISAITSSAIHQLM